MASSQPGQLIELLSQNFKRGARNIAQQQRIFPPYPRSWVPSLVAGAVVEVVARTCDTRGIPGLRKQEDQELKVNLGGYTASQKPP